MRTGKSCKMIDAVSSNGLISALYGPGVLRVNNAGIDRARQAADPTYIRGATQSGNGQDKVEFSTEGLKRAGLQNNTVSSTNINQTQNSADLQGKQLTDEEKAEVRKLKQRDREVRQHEQAHVAAGGSHVTGGPTYTYEKGPDGKSYAVGGEVQIDTSAVDGDPQATIRKMQQVRRAALAPAQPSSQDRKVAAQASAAEQKARSELREQQNEEKEVSSSNNNPLAAASQQNSNNTSQNNRISTQTGNNQSDELNRLINNYQNNSRFSGGVLNLSA